MIEEFIKKNYLTNEIIISSVGNISMNKLIKTIEIHFADLPKSNLKRKEVPFSNYLKKEVEIKRNVFQSHFMIVVEAYGINHPKKQL